VILQKSPLTEEQVEVLYQVGFALGMQPLFLPGASEALFAGLTTDEITLDQFLVQDEYNLFPTSDDSPFFFNITPGLPQPLQNLLTLTAGVLLVYLLLLSGARDRPSLWQLLFFAGLGLGAQQRTRKSCQRTLECGDTLATHRLSRFACRGVFPIIGIWATGSHRNVI
jgi:hypothetical protein